MLFRDIVRFIASFLAAVHTNVELKVAYAKNQIVIFGGKVMRGIRKVWGFAVIPFKTMLNDFLFLTKGFGGLFRLFFLVMVIGILVYVKYQETVVITVMGMIETFITAVYFKQKDREGKDNNNHKDNQ